MINFECLNKRCNYEEYCEDFKAPHICPGCDGKWYRLRFVKEPKKKKPFVSIAFPENVRYSWALGCQPNEREKMAKKHPGAEFTPDGRMIIHNRTEKKRRMKEAGYEEYA